VTVKYIKKNHNFAHTISVPELLITSQERDLGV